MLWLLWIIESEGWVLGLGERKNKANKIVSLSEWVCLSDIMNCLQFWDRQFGPGNLSYDDLRAVNEIKLALEKKLDKYK